MGEAPMASAVMMTRPCSGVRRTELKLVTKAGRVFGTKVRASSQREGSKVEIRPTKGEGEGEWVKPVQIGRRRLAGLAGLAGQFALEPERIIWARADEEPNFQLELPPCATPVAAAAPPPAPESAVEGEAAPEVAEVAAPVQTPCAGRDLGKLEMKSTSSGLQYKDLIEGDGDKPPVGYQVVVNYVVMLSNGNVISSTIDSGFPTDIRVGSGSVVAGIDEGILSMNSGGFRRLYIPGDLSFQQRLASAPGRAAVPEKSPLIVDVNLLYIPGID